MNRNQLLLIDLSAIAHQIWHISGSEPDPSFVSTQLVARVRALASQHPHAAICCDSGKSFRADLDPSYKAQRDTENRAPLRHQMDVACETLKRDGFPVWKVKGFEADDLIATSTRLATEMDGDVLVASADKDLLQLVTDRVTFRSTSPNTDGKVFTPTQVVEKFGVRPELMGDFLALVGDTSDNIKGASNIGPKTATDLLSKFGDLSSVFKAIFAAIPYEEAKGIYSAYANAGDAGWKKIRKDLESRVPVTPSVFLSLVEFFPRHPLVASLIALRSDVPEGDGFTFAEIATERVAAPMVEDNMDTTSFNEMNTNYGDLGAQSAPVLEAETLAGKVSTVRPSVFFERGNNANDAPLPFQAPTPTQAAPMAPPVDRIDTARARAVAEKVDANKEQAESRQELVLSQSSAPVDFSQQLEPRSMDEAVRLAQRMFESRLFSAYGTPQAVLATVLAGRELGIPAMASLRAFHIIEGKPTMSAGTIQSLVLKSKQAAYFRCTERTAEKATFVTKRGDDPEMALTYTIEEGKQAWSKDEAAWKKSGWGRNPADMLVARAASKLARLVYPDVVSGLYAPEEME